MEYTLQSLASFFIMGVSRKFDSREALTAIPKFWDEYYAKGCGQVACGQFGCCFDEAADGSFVYAIGNRCELEKQGDNQTVYHIFRCPDRDNLPTGFSLIEVPAQTWLKVRCLGPLPQSIQGTYPLIAKEWPQEYERLSGWELEEYGVCAAPEDSQKPDYQCFIWIPVKPREGRGE